MRHAIELIYKIYVQCVLLRGKGKKFSFSFLELFFLPVASLSCGTSWFKECSVYS